MAMRLGKLLGTPPESRLRMQTAVDLWDLVQRGGYDAIDAVKAA
jgi:plasmid maintenance system antidote protein VapI